MTDEPPPLGRKATLVRAEERRQACVELVEHVRSLLDDLTSRRNLRPRHFAAMSLARMTRLVESMIELVDAGFGDVVEGVGRTGVETFALGLYVLYGGGDAFDHVRGAHIRQRRTLSYVGIDAPEWEELLELERDWDGPTDKIVWQDLITQRLPQLIDPQGRTNAGVFFERLYGQTYRFGSMAGTHAGIGTIAQHHLDRGPLLGVRSVGHTTDDGTGALVFAATLLAMLASHVFHAFGIGTSRCDELLATLAADPDVIVDPE